MQLSHVKRRRSQNWYETLILCLKFATNDTLKLFQNRFNRTQLCLTVSNVGRFANKSSSLTYSSQHVSELDVSETTGYHRFSSTLLRSLYKCGSFR